jgi:ribonuclease HII
MLLPRSQMPDLSLELAAGGRVAGIDEAGRGPWAGPVVAAALVLRPDIPTTLTQRIDDSKKLRPAVRALLFEKLQEHADIGIGIASVAEIDYLNILQATMVAMQRALVAIGIAPDFVLVDGNKLPDLPCPARPIVRGDGRSLTIAAASIAAKVTRDNLMVALAAQHPGYGWERNMGYGTPEHRDALDTRGPTALHRFSFAPVARAASSHK